MNSMSPVLTERQQRIADLAMHFFNAMPDDVTPEVAMHGSIAFLVGVVRTCPDLTASALIALAMAADEMTKGAQPTSH